MTRRAPPAGAEASAHDYGDPARRGRPEATQRASAPDHADTRTKSTSMNCGNTAPSGGSPVQSFPTATLSSRLCGFVKAAHVPRFASYWFRVTVHFTWPSNKKLIQIGRAHV